MNDRGKRQDSELGTLDRIVSVATEVKAGEGLGALLLALNVCLLLTAYYLIKPVREALILAGGGAEIKSYAAAGQVALLSLVIPIYGRLVEKLPRKRLIPAVTTFFIGCLVLFYVAAATKLPFIGVAFFLFVGIFNVMILAQFWAYAADLYRRDQGERLFPVVALGGSVGAVAGSLIASELAKHMAPSALLLVSGGVLGATILNTQVIEKLMMRSPNAAEEPEKVGKDKTPKALPASPSEATKSDGNNPFQIVLRNRYLLLIAVFMLLTNIVNTTGEFILGSVVTDWAEKSATASQSTERLITVFYGEFFFWVNLVGFFVQLLLVSRVIRWIGIRGALLVLPFIAFSAYLAIALVPVLAVVRWVKTAENSTDYSLNNTVRNALFLPLSREEKYKGKQVIDTFFVRGGDVASAGIVALGLHTLSWTQVGFAWFNVGVVAVWVVVAILIGRHYARLSNSMIPEAEAEKAD